MKCQILPSKKGGKFVRNVKSSFLKKIIKNIVSFSSDELVQRVVKVIVTIRVREMEGSLQNGQVCVSGDIL